jgi:hypothetical protein
MVELSASYENGILTIKRKKYIEDGWYIENFGKNWKLLEIQYGGEPEEVSRHESFESAYKAALQLA